MILIGIAGKKRHGKDTICKILQDNIKNRPVIRIAFADALKEEIAKACGVTVEYIDANKDLFRTILQWWGTEFRRGQDKEYWIKKWLVKAAKQPDNSVVVVPDVRFYNEADVITRAGGYVWCVNRPQYKDDKDTHASEATLGPELITHFFVNHEDNQAQLEIDVMFSYNNIIAVKRTIK